MLHAFKYIDTALRQDATAARKLYGVLAPVFESSILVAHRSKFVQFILFFLCGLETKLVAELDEANLFREFAAKLLMIVLDPYRATVTRQSSACYVASFVSRASFVCAETTCESVCALLRWAKTYISSIDSGSVHATDAREQCEKHSLFYTVCQAAFYIMCFRGAQAFKYYRTAFLGEPKTGTSVGKEHLDISPTNWEVVCCHPLQPLRYCLESVRGEFLQVARSLCLLTPDSLDRLSLEDQRMSTTQSRKRPSRISTTATLEKERMRGGVGGLGGGSNPLDSFFPFDPYLLSHSHEFVDQFYNHWDGTDACSDGAEEDDVSSNDDEGETEGSESDDSDDMVLGTPKPDTLQYPASLASTNTECDSTGSPIAYKTRDSQRTAWSDSLKRTRAASIENGSW